MHTLTDDTVSALLFACGLGYGLFLAFPAAYVMISRERRAATKESES